MSDAHWYAELIHPVACPACAAKMPAERSDDIAPFLWHLERDGAPWQADASAPPHAAVELAGPCSRCGGEVTYRSPGDVHLVAQPFSPASAGTPALRVVSAR